MQIVFTILILVFSVAVSGVLSRLSPLHLPRPLFQIALGAILALCGVVVHFDPEIFLLLFIPPLLFVDGWRMPKQQLFRLHQPILELALGLVLVTVVTVGWFIHWLVPAIPLPAAFALAAVLSPTDAVAVSSIIGRGKMPSTLQGILQGESLLNDASGLVAFKFAIAAALTGAFSLWQASLSFLLIALGGLATGAVLAWLVGLGRNMVSRWTDDEPAIQVVLLMLVPFAAYLLAEELGVSGILSAVAAGIAMTYTDTQGAGNSSATRMQSNSVWSMLEFVFNGMTFILLGLQLPAIAATFGGDAQGIGISAWQLLGYVVAIALALVVLRLGWAGFTVLLRAMGSKLLHRPRAPRPNPWTLLVFAMAGVRGSITLAGVLATPLFLAPGVPFPQRQLMILLAAGVILCSLLSASVLLPLGLSRLPPFSESRKDKEMKQARLRMAHAALEGLEQATERLGQVLDAEGKAVLDEVSANLARQYNQRVDAESGPDDVAARATLHRRFERDLRMAVIYSQRKELHRLRETRQIDDDVYRGMLRNVDLLENWLDGPLLKVD